MCCQCSVYILIYRDGTLKCITGGHLLLAIVAVLVLIFCVPVMMFVTAVIMRKIKVCVNITIDCRISTTETLGIFHGQTPPKGPIY